MVTTDYKSYQNLIHSDTKLYIQAHGDTGTFALAFAGPESEIQKWYNFFSNFDNRGKNEYNEFPKSPRLVYIGPRFAYINITKERLYNAFKLYFVTNLPLCKDIPSSYSFDEETEVETWTRDDALIDSTANDLANQFIAEHIQTQCFMPQSYKSDIGGYVNSIRQNNHDTDTMISQIKA